MKTCEEETSLKQWPQNYMQKKRLNEKMQKKKFGQSIRFRKKITMKFKHFCIKMCIFVFILMSQFMFFIFSFFFL